MEEIWTLIPSLQNKYEASSAGRIRYSRTLHILKPQINMHGYLQISAYIDGKYKTFRVHRLVAEVFLGVCPKGYVVNHKDGNKQNNAIENLEYVTHSQNNQHALDTGLRSPAKNIRPSARGENNANAKLTKEIVFEILSIRKEKGYGCRRIAKILNISRGTVNAILSGRTWKDAVEEYQKRMEK